MRSVQRSRQPFLADPEGRRQGGCASADASGAGAAGAGDSDDSGLFTAGPGRSERNFGTWQGRLPQELRLHGISALEGANAFLREHYMAEFNQRFQVASRQRGTAFTRCPRRDLERVFSLQYERTVNRDNTVSLQNLVLPIERVGWRGTLADCNVIVHEHLDGTLSISYGPHQLGRYSAQGELIRQTTPAMEKTPGGKVPKATFPPGLEIPQRMRDSHFPTASTATVL